MFTSLILCEVDMPVCLVGYTKDYFIARNSWGTDWGDKGFAYAYNDYALAAFTEAYGAAL